MLPTLRLVPLMSLLAVFSIPVQAAKSGQDPALVIQAGTRQIVFKRSELLRRKDLVTLKIDYDPALPGKTMNYKAVPAHALFEGVAIPPEATIQFKCLDGFAGPIDRAKLLNSSSSGSIAYLAIEPPDEKWPSINPPSDMRTPGPFYLVWTDPKKSAIGQEQWPFQLAGFEVKGTLASLFPNIHPRNAAANVSRGFESFKKNCFACHTMNNEGEAQLGPDLNLPRNPTEYFDTVTLRAFIRDPQSLHHWPQSKMTPFSKEQLSDSELGDLVAYLKEMKGHKKR